MLKWNLDALGIGASLICALHCALLPLLLTVLPVMDLHLPGYIEYILLALSFIAGCGAILRGRRRLLLLLLFGAGFTGLLTGHFLLEDLWEALLVMVGAAFIIAAHLVSMRDCRICRYRYLD